MTTVTWFQGARDGDWAVAGNWAGGAVPGLSATVSLSDTVANTITISAADYVIISGLVATGPINNRLIVAGGTLGVGGPADFGTGFTVTSGDVALAGTSSAGTGYDLGGTITLGTASTTLTLSGTGTLHADLQGPGTLITTGTTSVTGGSIGAGVFAGGLVWQIKGATAITPGATLHVTDPAALIAVTGMGSLTFAGDGGIVDSTGPAHVTNAGTIAKTGGTGISQLDGALVNTGTVSATSGTLRLGGAISGSGTWSAGTGATLDLAGGGLLDGTFTTSGTGHLLLSAGTFAFTGTTRTLATPLALTGTIALGKGQTLTLSGSDSLNGTLTGPGTLVTSGATSISGGSIGGGLTWRMTSATTLTNGATLTVTDTASTIAVTSTGSLTFAGDGGIVDSTGPSHVTNAGTIAKTGGTGLSELDGVLVNTGTVSVTSGTLRLGGAISGTGTWSAGTGATLDLAGGGLLDGTFTTSGTGHLLLSAGSFGFTGTTRTLATPLALTGTIALGTGQTLTLSGSDNLNGTLTGPGTLVTSGATSISGGSIGGGLTWRMTGATTLANGATLTVTDTASTIAVTSTGSLTFAGDGGIVDSTGPAHVTNAGTIAKTGGTGISELDGALVNTGTVSVTSGTLRLGDAISGSGTWSAGTGATLDLAGGGLLDGTFTTSGTGHLLLSAGSFGFTGTARTLAASLALTGTIALGKGQTLTLSGSDNLNGTLTGPGTLVTSGATSISGGSIGGGLTWQVTGAATLAVGATLAITDSVSTIAIGTTGSLIFAGDGAVTGLADPAPVINAGLIIKSGGNHLSEVAGTVINTGTIEADSGELRFNGAVTTTGTLILTDGQVAFNAGGRLGGTLVETGTTALGLLGGVFTVGSQDAPWGAVAMLAQLQLAGGQTFAIGDGSELGNLVLGDGTLILGGRSTLETGQVGQGATVAITGITTLGDGTYTLGMTGPSAATGVLHVAAGGTLQLIGTAQNWLPSIASLDRADLTSVLAIDGTLAKTGNGDNLIAAPVVSSGTIAVSDGRLTITGALTTTGTLAVTQFGALVLSGGGALGGSVTTADTGAIQLAAGHYSLAANAVRWSGKLGIAQAADLTIDAGQSLTLGGEVTFAGTTHGTGSLILSGKALLSNTFIGQGSILTVQGQVTTQGGVFLGYNDSTGNTAANVLDIAAGGTLLLGNGSSFDFSSAAPQIRNAGTLTLASGATSASITGNLTNTGTIRLSSGYLDATAKVDNEGAIVVTGGRLAIHGAFTGAGSLSVAIGARLDLTGGGVLTPAITSLTGGVLYLDRSWTLGTNAVTLDGRNGKTIAAGKFALGADQTLTLTGQISIDGGGFQGSGIVGHGGTVVTTGTASAKTVDLVRNVTWQIAAGTTQVGSVDLAATLTPEGSGATLMIASAGTYTITGRGIADTAHAGAIVNAGVLKSASVFALITDRVANTGSILVSSGWLTLAGGVDNSGEVKIAAGAQLDLQGPGTGLGGRVTNAGTLRLDSNGATLVSGTLTNNGTITDFGDVTLTHVVDGTGTIEIAARSRLDLLQTSAAGQTIRFYGADANGSTLVLHALDTVTVDGLNAGDTIDFAGISLTSAMMSGNALTVKAQNGATGSLTLASPLTGLATALSSDGQGGTLVTFASTTLASPWLLGDKIVDLGHLHAGATITRTLTFQNLPIAAASEQGLQGAIIATSGAISGSGTSTIAYQGLYASLTVTFSGGTTLGQVSGTATIGFTSIGLVGTPLPAQTVTFTATIENMARAGFAAQTGLAIKGNATTGYTLDLGTIGQAASTATWSIGAANLAKGPADALMGTLTDAGGSAFGAARYINLAALGAGQSALVDTLTIDRSQIGTFTDTITINGTSNADDWLNVLDPITLTVTITVTTTAQTSYSLSGKADTIVGNATTNSAISTRATDLGKADAITGGPGQNTFTLIGKGKFNLNLPATLSAIGTIIATEGQAASGALPATIQTVTLRDGVAETLRVNSGTAAPGNAGPLAITINTGTGRDTILLSTGHDTVRLGSGQADITLGAKANAVHGGSGTATIHAKAGQAGALIVGTAPGTLTLDITTKGKATLNAHDADLTVAIKAGSTLDLSTGTGIVADASAGHDSVIAHAAGQVMIGGDGDIFTSAGGDTFRFGAGFGHETINGFVGTGAGHDTLAFAHTVFADAAHVLSAAAQVGSDVVITLDAADTITLAHVALASLSAQDVLII